MSAAEPTLPPERIGKYPVIRKLGEGAFLHGPSLGLPAMGIKDSHEARPLRGGLSPG